MPEFPQRLRCCSLRSAHTSCSAIFDLATPISYRATASALVNLIGGTSKIWSSYLYSAPPHFYAAFGIAVSQSLCAPRFRPGKGNEAGGRWYAGKG
ncbi:uncharacterized protein MYCFIDRAFT_212124 [Pseudocercospora fijiensis CIRAD86]|uniref:Uncharacterized protein n=1 Tax=Pseudocercospora fijiensis (strain CIRAD86) TaxID=383855 RepID=M3ANL5_PSEFD|nr:uncharacterized protein MYCFIDRAFT_212124 [Pseudocercospora fijiensis CIRAD86]EME79062.1 hypothetical protein MYCFIDRAFT_212124 [Pseudocercospora fijiensis CIRAD86]